MPISPGGPGRPTGPDVPFVPATPERPEIPSWPKCSLYSRCSWRPRIRCWADLTKIFFSLLQFYISAINAITAI
uniref:Candidate secreted effector n=1 Tax=Meloidogyne incognita TaxID=6306 RepID=A0A914L928_MELIC